MPAVDRDRSTRASGLPARSVLPLPDDDGWTSHDAEPIGIALSSLAAEAALGDGQLRRALATLLRGHESQSTAIDASAIDASIADVDDALERQIEAIVTAPPLMRLEGAWRGLHHAVASVGADANVQFELWNARRDELLDDLEDSPTLTASRTFAQLYSAEYGQFGGCPYAAFLLDFEIDASPRDARLVRAFATLSAMAHAPTLAAAAPAIVGARTFEEVAESQDLRVVDDDPRLLRWRAVRALPDSKYIGLLMPRVLARVGVATEETPAWLAQVAADRRLWTSPIYVVATLLARSFVRFGWCAHITGLDEDGRPGDGVAKPIASSITEALRAQRHSTPALEAVVGARLAGQLADLGLVVLRHRPENGDLVLFEAPSIQRASTEAGDGVRLLDAFLGAQLPFLFIICRLAHYLKVLQRESLGAELEPQALERALQDWLSQFIVDIEDASAELRGKRPLRDARITVQKRDDQRGWFSVELRIQPHMRYLGSSFTLAVHGRLDRR